ncbi:MAG: hypothetical protein JJU19_08165 [Pararhodobacter sp.]|nr:hypothetical protein [Pararhodobacter sp.]
MTAAPGIQTRVFAGEPLEALCHLAIQCCADIVRAGGTVDAVQIVEGEKGLEVHVRWKAARGDGHV